MARDCTWAAASGAAWVVITSATSGQGDASIALKVAAPPPPPPPPPANLRRGARRLTSTLMSRRRSNQAAADCRYRAAPLAAAVDAAVRTITVDVETNAACEWTAVSDAAWIRLAGGATGKGNGAVTLVVDASSGATRSGTVRVAGQTVTVTQAAVSCTYRLRRSGRYLQPGPPSR